MHRLFVAITLPEDLRDRLADLCHGLQGARWSVPDNFHLTLRFIGEVDGAMLDEIAHALSEIEGQPFALAIDGLGHFESRSKPKVLWAGLTASEPLRHLRDQVETALTRAGLERDTRRFSPHVTLGRLRGTLPEELSQFIALNSPLRSEPFDVTGITLFQSFLGSEQAIHRVEADYPLGFDQSLWSEADEAEIG